MCFGAKSGPAESKAIEKDIKKASKEMAETKKVLLLGSGLCLFLTIFNGLQVNLNTLLLSQLTFRWYWQNDFRKTDDDEIRRTELPREVYWHSKVHKVTRRNRVHCAYVAWNVFLHLLRINVLSVFKEVISYLYSLDVCFTHSQHLQQTPLSTSNYCPTPGKRDVLEVQLCWCHFKVTDKKFRVNNKQTKPPIDKQTNKLINKPNCQPTADQQTNNPQTNQIAD